ncbi:MAG: contact-dependent growth inhibition system immunity protein [Actinomycetota bacterium]
MDWLILIALDLLTREPLAEGDFPPGDLLVNVLRVPVQLWSDQPIWRQRLENVLSQLSQSPREVTNAQEFPRRHGLKMLHSTDTGRFAGRCPLIPRSAARRRSSVF